MKLMSKLMGPPSGRALFEAPCSVSSGGVDSDHLKLSTEMVHALKISRTDFVPATAWRTTPILWLFFRRELIQLSNCSGEMTPYKCFKHALFLFVVQLDADRLYVVISCSRARTDDTAFLIGRRAQISSMLQAWSDRMILVVYEPSPLTSPPYTGIHGYTDTWTPMTPRDIGYDMHRKSCAPGRKIRCLDAVLGLRVRD